MVTALTKLFARFLLPGAAAYASFAALVALGSSGGQALFLAVVWGYYLRVYVCPEAVERFLGKGGESLARPAVRFAARLTLRVLSPQLFGLGVYHLFPRFLSAPSAGVRRPLFPDISGSGHVLTLEDWTVRRWFVTLLAGLVVEVLLRLNPKPAATVPLRGRTLWTIPQAIKIADQIRPKDDPGIPFGGVLLESEIKTLHIAILGTTGSGKTLTLRLLMQRDFASIGKGKNVRGIVYDAKGDVIPYLVGMGIPPERIINMNVLDREGVAWDMCRDVRDDVAVAAVAEILFPANPKAKEPFFDDAARALMEGVMNVFVERTPDSWQFSDVIHAMRNKHRLVEVLKLNPEGRDLVELYFSKESTALDVMATVANKTKPFTLVSGAWAHAKRKISLTEFFQDELVLVLGNSHVAKPTMRAVNQVLFVRLVQLILEQPNDGTQRLSVFIDELRTARFDVESLLLLADEGRSRGVSLNISSQDYSGLQAVYGEKETDELLGMCNSIAILKATPKTAEYGASLFGKYEGFEESKGYSVNEKGKRTDQTNENLVTRDTVMGAQFMNLPRCSKRNGLWGYYIAPDIGAWWGCLSGDYLTANLIPPDKSVPRFIRRDKDKLKLLPWTAEDCYRLQLDPGLSLDPSDFKPEQGNVVELEPRRKMKASGLKHRRRKGPGHSP